MSYNITPILSTGPLNSNVGFNNSWITIDNDFDRPLYAQLTYDTKSAVSQEQIITLLEKIDANTNHVEDLIVNSNNFLNLIYAFEDIINNNITDAKNLLVGSQTELTTTVKILTSSVDIIRILNTSLTAIQTDKQDQVITLLHQLTANTDTLEVNTDTLEVLVSSLTSIQTDKQDQVITLLHQLTANTDTLEVNTDTLEVLIDSLTSIQTDKQDQLITLLHQLTANTDTLEVNTDTLEVLIDSLTSIQTDKQDQLINLTNSLTASNIKVPGFSIPTYDEIDIEYVLNTNNIQKVSYINNSTTVLSLSFTYIPNPPIFDNATLKNVKKI